MFQFNLTLLPSNIVVIVKCHALFLFRGFPQKVFVQIQVKNSIFPVEIGSLKLEIRKCIVVLALLGWYSIVGRQA